MEPLQNRGEKCWWRGPGGGSGSGDKELILDLLCAEDAPYLLIGSMCYITGPEERGLCHIFGFGR